MNRSVSVVIPTFRRERMLVRAIRSALVQTAVDVRVIVLDDSAENSACPSVEELADPRVHFVPCDAPTGGVPARLRNRGLALASGAYVHFLDDDDALEPGALAALVDALEGTPGAGVAAGRVTAVGEDRDVLEQQRLYFETAARRLRRLHRATDLVAAMLFETTPLVNSACLVRREIALAVGGYSEDVARCEDVEFYLRAIRASGFAFVDRPVVRYQTGAPSLMHTETDARLLRESYEVIYRHFREQRGATEFYRLKCRAVWRRLAARWVA